MSLDDLLQSILGGAGAGQQRSSAQSGSGDSVSDMLDAILRGGSASGQGGSLEDILGGATGSGAARPSSSGQAGMGGLMDILSTILGDGPGGNVEEQSTSIIEGVSGKTGLSQMLVQLALSFVMSKLLGGMAGGGAGMGGLLPGTESGSTATPGRSAGGGLDLDDLLAQMSRDPRMAAELAQKTGMDNSTAQQSLQEVLGALNQQRHSGGADSSRPKTGGMDDLLFR